MRSRTVLLIVAAAVLIAGGVGAAGYYLIVPGGRQLTLEIPRTSHSCWLPWNATEASLTDTAESKASPPQGDEPSPQWSRAFDQIAEDVERVRGLKFSEPVRRLVMSPEQMSEYVRKSFEGESDREAFQRAEDVLKYLALLPVELDLAGELGDAFGGQVAGFYDDESKVLVVRTDLGSPQSPVTRSVIAHELVHALDDQHFNLQAMGEPAKEVGRSDEALAIDAVVEGVAMLASLEYLRLSYDMPDNAEIFDQLATAMKGQSDASIPLYISEHMMFPYASGGKFVSETHRTGGWDAVNALYRDPPKSTAEIVHPDRSSHPRWVPDTVRVGGVTETIESIRGERWFQFGEGVMGEYDISLLLNSAEITNVASAVDGWRGDWYRYVGCVNQRLFAAEYSLATEADASELGNALDIWGSRWASQDPAGGRTWVVVSEGRSVTMVIGGDKEIATQVSAR
ncbi:MAG: hypothetical protein DCC49_06400 [Acidobacteria bacterium]|nr:MAG: hypothetical protein DCC49_06400 [Acidobacteriota bacterium]